MCGITGFVDATSQQPAPLLKAQVTAMADRLRRRGPDDAGAWVDEDAGAAFGFRRLSIIDLSAAGHQPMISANGRLVIVYNGEIYNYRELRRELETQGAAFRGHSDTEVMLEAFASWGVQRTLARLIGMFAIALWDRSRRRLTLVRDRLGIKPLYWGQFGSLLLFGSELKALTAHPGWQAEIDRDAVAGFLRLNYVPAPHSIYRGVHKLEPGRVLTYEPGDEIHFRGEADLGWLAGGVYSYEGNSLRDDFYSEYHSEYDHGIFEMQIVPDEGESP